MTGVRCSGSELDVTDCPHSDDVTGCDVTESAAVSCLPDTPTPPPRTINTVYFTSLCVISLCTYSLFETSCKPKPGCSPTGYPPRRLLIIVECQLTGLLPSSAALALLVVSRRTRVSGKCLRGKCPGECPFPGGQCPFPGVLVLSAAIVDGRPRVLHVRQSSASWMNAHSLLHIGLQCFDAVGWAAGRASGL